MDIRSNGTTSNCSYSCTSTQAPTQIQSPVLNSRSDPNNPYPTTFVTADASSFKQVVQMLTGSPTTTSNKPTPPTTPTATQNDAVPISPSSSRSSFVIPPIKTAPGKKQQQGFKLYERRNSLKHRLLMINPQNASFPSRKPPEIISPSVLDFPSLTLSPVTPLSAAGDDDQFDKSSHSSAEEERAIAERGFYLHPSPMSTPRDSEPQLLPLFPVTSPRVSDPSSSSFFSIVQFDLVVLPGIGRFSSNWNLEQTASISENLKKKFPKD
ncbi:hypothetical protein V2J09_007695 [Rumex salicifolius]